MSMVMRLLGLELKLAGRTFMGRISGDKGRWRAYLLLGLMCLGFLPLILMLVGSSVGGYLVLKAGGQPEAILTLTLVFGQVVALVFGFFYIMSSFYFARDLRILLPLPLKPSDIVAAKFIRVVLIEYVTMGAIMLPAYVAYGIGSGTPLFWLFALVTFLLAPVLPLAIDALVAVALMSVTAAKRFQPSRDMFRVVGALIGLAIFLVFQLGVKSSVQQGAPSNLPGVHIETHGGRGEVTFMEGNNPLAGLFANVDLVQKLGHTVPPAIWVTHGMSEPTTGRGLAGMGGYVALNVGLLVLLMVVTNKVYLKGLLADEGGAPRKAATASEVSAGVAQVRTPLKALVWREIVLLVRTPIFLINVLMPMIIIPISFGVPLLKGGSLASIQATLTSGQGPWAALAPVLGIALLTFASSATPLNATSVSREGRKFWISRILPVDPGVQVLAKWTMGLIYVGILAVLVGVLALVLLHLPVLSVLLMMVGGVTAGLMAQTGGLLIDLVRPSLAWTDPQQAMKSNINGLLGLLVTLLELIGLAGVSAALYFLASPALMAPVVIVLTAAGTYLLLRWAMHLARVRYREIEE